MSDLSDMSKLFRLDGKVALVTGSRGLGLHAATAFLKAGASKVILAARKAEGPQGLDQAVKRLNELPGVQGSAVGISANVATLDGIESLLKQIGEIVDRLDILVANAGTTWGGPFEPTPDWSSQKILDLNVRGVFNLVRLAVPLLEKSGSRSDPSRIVIVSSVAGTNVTHTGDHGTIMYSASKAAAHHLARNFAVELGPRNITSNAVAPGFFPTRLANGLIQELGGQEALERENPRLRLGVPDDIGGVMVFLCSRAGSYVNGEDIAVDGGARWKQGTNHKL
ncbi:NAD(P)-binding protein [Pseudovirgaria hyperparasitica]|uniref:NAD(P)-binding protein n=1 Tax=Pseudovirgaria hyperparasitica TaxID=470096 RepID=A0A6A6VZU3_9PEZI|nr:NAD(P)-binding protein [Pseudovirgaria hyperparasitica]KAF2755409.1 NAD(P)-binding protein [Pseudovirgaria hyperparasitica]